MVLEHLTLVKNECPGQAQVWDSGIYTTLKHRMQQLATTTLNIVEKRESGREDEAKI